MPWSGCPTTLTCSNASTPTKDKLPFSVDSEVVKKLTDTPLEALHEGGRLFVADHSNQKKYKTQAGRYQTACTGFFYLDARSNQFPPLATRIIVGADLTYTPLDDKNDWLLAKMFFNYNDLFNSPMSHVLFHVGSEIIHESAFRSLSDDHLVMAVTDRSCTSATVSGRWAWPTFSIRVCFSGKTSASPAPRQSTTPRPVPAGRRRAASQLRGERPAEPGADQ